MEKTQFLELVVVILLILNAILMNRTTKLNEEIDSMKMQTEIFLNDLSHRIHSVEKENKDK